MVAAYYGNSAYKYGNATRHYDEQPADFDEDRLTWRVEFAWESTYVHFSEDDGRTEADRCIDCYWTRGRPNMINYDGSGLQWFPPGRMVATLTNDDGRYDPNNASSPLYPNVAPGKLCRIGVRLAGSDGYAFDDSHKWRFTGCVVDIRAYENERGEKFVEIMAEDGWGWLMGHNVYLGLVEDQEHTPFMGSILDESDWPHIWRRQFGLSTRLPYLFADGMDARTTLNHIGATMADRIFIRGDGTFKSLKRTTGIALSGALSQSQLLKKILLSNPWENVYNYVTLKAREAHLHADIGAVWGDLKAPTYFAIFPVTSADEDRRVDEISIPAGESLLVESGYGLVPGPGLMVFNSEDEFAMAGSGPWGAGTAITPPNFIYQFRTATGGGGVDVSGYMEAAFKDGGRGFSLLLTNHYSATIYSNVLLVWCLRILIFNSRQNLQYSVDRTAGAVRKTFRVDTPYLLRDSPQLTPSILQNTATYYADLVTANQSLPTVELEAQPDVQFLDLFEKVLLTVPAKGINKRYLISMIEESWLAQNGQAIKTTLHTEPYVIDGSAALTKYFVAVAADGAADCVMRSSSGLVWSSGTCPISSLWIKVAWSPDLGILVAVGAAGAATYTNTMLSEDGITWFNNETPILQEDWNDVVWAPELGLFVAVSLFGWNATRIMTSPDGLNWTPRFLSITHSFRAIAWSPDLGLLVALGQTAAGNLVMTSPDGTNWTVQACPDRLWRDVVWAASLGLFVAVCIGGDINRVMTSPDGVNWTSQAAASTNNWESLTWSEDLGLLVAVATSGVGNRVMTSPDAINWTGRVSAADNEWQNVAWSSALSLFAAVASTGVGNRIMTSPTGIVWTSRANPVDNDWYGVVFME